MRKHLSNLNFFVTRFLTSARIITAFVATAIISLTLTPTAFAQITTERINLQQPQEESYAEAAARNQNLSNQYRNAVANVNASTSLEQIKQVAAEQSLSEDYVAHDLKKKMLDAQNEIHSIRNQLYKMQIRRGANVVVAFTSWAIVASALLESYMPEKFVVDQFFLNQLAKTPALKLEAMLTQKLGTSNFILLQRTAVAGSAVVAYSSTKWIAVNWYSVDTLAKALDQAERKLGQLSRDLEVLSEDNVAPQQYAGQKKRNVISYPKELIELALKKRQEDQAIEFKKMEEQNEIEEKLIRQGQNKQVEISVEEIRKSSRYKEIYHVCDGTILDSAKVTFKNAGRSFLSTLSLGIFYERWLGQTKTRFGFARANAEMLDSEEYQQAMTDCFGNNFNKQTAFTASMLLGDGAGKLVGAAAWVPFLAVKGYSLFSASTKAIFSKVPLVAQAQVALSGPEVSFLSKFATAYLVSQASADLIIQLSDYLKYKKLEKQAQQESDQNISQFKKSMNQMIDPLAKAVNTAAKKRIIEIETDLSTKSYSAEKRTQLIQKHFELTVQVEEYSRQ